MNRICVEHQTYDAERALYGLCGVNVESCRFDGPADGESALKECRGVIARDSYFNLRYPFWHDEGLLAERCELTENCRAAIWYCEDVALRDCSLHGIKALRECRGVQMQNCSVRSEEFGWMSERVTMADTHVEGAYFMFRGRDLVFDGVTLRGKYSFQYVENAVFRHCNFDTKDALWHAKNVRLEDCTVRGEYLAWYCENVTFVRCHIVGTQPLCYCGGLELIDCTMEDADLAFERSAVRATLLSPIISIKNPREGTICAPSVGEIIMDDPLAQGTVSLG
jgi:hypothetical protein